jgi:uncharacterized protein (TIGR00255 family)
MGHQLNMTIYSMTGFARVSGASGRHSWAWELKSVNGRGLDVRLRVPPGFDVLGEEARKLVQGQLARGSVQINMSLQSAATEMTLKVNEAALGSLIAALNRVTLPNNMKPASLDGLLGVRGIVELAADEEDVLTALGPAMSANLADAVSALCVSRAGEGAAIHAMLSDQIYRIEKLVLACESHPSRTIEAIRERLAGQVALLIGNAAGLDASRLHQEAALLAVKADVREEIDRLKAHIAAARLMLQQGGAVGRKLDFLSQEFGRETSTLCAKANDVSLSAIGLELRTIVDQMREQVQNVE